MTEKNFHALMATLFAVLTILNLYAGLAYSNPLSLVIGLYTMFRTYQLTKQCLDNSDETKVEVKDAE